MIPLLEAGLSLVGHKGLDAVLKRGAKATKAVARPDGLPEYALAAAAIAPQLVNVLGPSPLVGRYFAPTATQLYWLYKARPYLDGLSAVAAAGLTLRQRSSGTRGDALQLVTRATMALRLAAQAISPPTQAEEAAAHLVVTGREIEKRLKPDDMVVGLYLNGEARCYPLSLLRRPHLVHDTVGGVPVVPTYCELSNAAIAYRDDWRGERLDLHVVASPNGNVAFYEGRADGIIQQLDGEIGAGPNAGAVLQTFPVALTTWRQWKDMHPATTALWYEQGPKGGAAAILQAFTALDGRQRKPMFHVRGGIDTRLDAKAEVFGVRLKGQAIAFERQALRANPVQELELAGEPIVILYDEVHDVAACYSRRLEGQVRSFKPVRHGNAVAEDDQGRLWEVGGTPTDDVATRQALRPAALAADRVRWYAWAHFNPSTRLAGETTAVALAKG